jgi:hypothetical protein
MLISVGSRMAHLYSRRLILSISLHGTFCIFVCAQSNQIRYVQIKNGTRSTVIESNCRHRPQGIFRVHPVSSCILLISVGITCIFYFYADNDLEAANKPAARFTQKESKTRPEDVLAWRVILPTRRVSMANKLPDSWHHRDIF